MPRSIYALAATDIQANGIIIALGAIGFLVDDLSVLMPCADPPRDGAPGSPHRPADAAASAGGVGRGTPVGGALGWITGIGGLTIPGLGPFIAAGPVKALLDGTVLGNVDGDLADALIGLGLPKAASHRYENRVRDGRILIIAHSDRSAWMAKATQVLRDAGAEDIGCSNEEASPPAPSTVSASPVAEGATTDPSPGASPAGLPR
jgi:hypothetical protein